jgi:hypothetical protein
LKLLSLFTLKFSGMSQQLLPAAAAAAAQVGLAEQQ